MPEPTDNAFQLFPEDKKPSPGDAFIQFLSDEQEKGNKRFRSTLDTIFEPVFPGFSSAIDDLLKGADKRKKQLNKVFGLELGEPTTPEDISEIALGFGVGSIGRVPPGIKPFKPSTKLTDKKVRELIGKTEETGQENKPSTSVSEPGRELLFREENIGGRRPSNRILEAQTIEAQATKGIQAKEKRIQKDLNKRMVEEVDLASQDVLQSITAKGLRAKSQFSGEFQVKFESKPNSKNPEFLLRDTPEAAVKGALILEVNFNSRLIKPELASVLKRQFPEEFIQDIIESPGAAIQMQRMLQGTSEGVEPPAFYSKYFVENFEDGLKLINQMLDITNAR